IIVNTTVLGRVHNHRGVALLPKIVPDKAHGAGRSIPTTKPRNAGWRATFNGSGGATLRAGAIFPQSCVAARYGRVTTVRSLRLVLQKNGRCCADREMRKRL